MEELSGKDFNKKYPNDKFIVLIDTFNHDVLTNIQLKLGVNDMDYFNNNNDKKKKHIQKYDGYYIINIKYIHDYLDYKGSLVNRYRIVTVPDNAIVKQDGDKFVSDIIITQKLQHIKDLEYWNDDEFCKKVVTKYREKLKYVRNMTKEICMLALQYDGNNIKYIKNPIQEMYNTAINQTYMAIFYTPAEFQDPELCLQVIKKDYESSRAIQFIKNPTQQQCLEAVNINGMHLQYIKNNQTYEICMEAVKQYGTALSYVNKEHMTDELIKMAMEGKKMAGHLLHLCKNMTPEIIKLAIKNSEIAYYCIPKKLITPELQLMVVKENGKVIKFIDNPTFELCQEAVKQNPLSIIYIKNKDIQLQLYQSGLNSYQTKYKLFEEFVQQYRNKVCQPYYTQRDWIFNTYNNDNLLKITECYHQIREVVLDAMEKYTFDDINPIFKSYGVEYKDDDYMRFCYRDDALLDEHINLLNSVVYLDLPDQYSFICGDINILLKDEVKAMNTSTFSSIFFDSYRSYIQCELLFVNSENKIEYYNPDEDEEIDHHLKLEKHYTHHGVKEIKNRYFGIVFGNEDSLYNDDKELELEENNTNISTHQF